MASPYTLFFAGVGTVVVALAGGFGGGIFVADQLNDKRTARQNEETPLVQAMQNFDQPKSIKAPEPETKNESQPEKQQADSEKPQAQPEKQAIAHQTPVTAPLGANAPMANAQDTRGKGESEHASLPSEQAGRNVASESIPVPQPRPVTNNPVTNAATSEVAASEPPARQTQPVERPRQRTNNEIGNASSNVAANRQQAQQPQQNGRPKQRKTDEIARTRDEPRRSRTDDDSGRSRQNAEREVARGDGEFEDDNGVRHVVRTRSGRKPTQSEIDAVKAQLRSQRQVATTARDRGDRSDLTRESRSELSYQSERAPSLFGLFGN